MDADEQTAVPSCLHLHADTTKTVREHECHMPPVESKLVKCRACKNHRAPATTGVCWWCEQVLNDSVLRKLPA